MCLLLPGIWLNHLWKIEEKKISRQSLCDVTLKTETIYLHGYDMNEKMANSEILQSHNVAQIPARRVLVVMITLITGNYSSVHRIALDTAQPIILYFARFYCVHSLMKTWNTIISSDVLWHGEFFRNDLKTKKKVKNCGGVVGRWWWWWWWRGGGYCPEASRHKREF